MRWILDCASEMDDCLFQNVKYYLADDVKNSVEVGRHSAIKVVMFTGSC